MDVGEVYIIQIIAYIHTSLIVLMNLIFMLKKRTVTTREEIQRELKKGIIRSNYD